MFVTCNTGFGFRCLQSQLKWLTRSPITPVAQCKSYSYMFWCDFGVPYDLRRGMTPPNSLASDCSYMSRNMVHGRRDCVQSCGSHTAWNHRWFEHCAGKGDLHFPGWPHGSVDCFRDYDVGFFTSSLASNRSRRIHVSRTSRGMHISVKSERRDACPFLEVKSQLRDAHLLLLPPACVHDYGRSSASAAFQYDARCWCISMSQCVQLRRQLRTGVGVCSPRPDGHSESRKYGLTYGLRRTGC